MDKQLKHNLSALETWRRGLFMLLFAVIYSVAEFVLGVVVLIQFLFVLVSGARNRRLLDFGRELSRFLYEIFLFLTFNTDTKPFPFADWPGDASPKDATQGTGGAANP